MMTSIFEEIREKRIKGYHNEPDRLREDANTESDIVGDYQGRAIMELLQNADDAQFNPDSNPNFQRVGDYFIKFELTKERLIARNGGYPITEEGIRSLAGSHISPKDKKVMIGNKGIGFKSVLEITGKPIMHSFPFHFEFSEEESRKLLEKEKLLGILKGTDLCPILRLPFELSEQRKDENGEWATEIQLPLKDQKAYGKSIEMLEKIDSEVLIFLQGLKRITYKNTDGKVNVCFSCDRENTEPGELKDGEMLINGGVSRYYRWVKTEPIPEKIREELPRNWHELTHGQVAMAVLLEEGDRNRTKENRIRVYFPTEEFSPVKILIHGNYRADSTRKRIHDESYNHWLSELTGLLLKEKLIMGIQKECPGDEGKVLDYLKPRIDTKRKPGTAPVFWADAIVC